MTLLEEFRATGARRLLALQALIDTIGTGLSVGVLAVYLVGPAHFSSAHVAVLLGLVGVTGFAATFAAAPLAQRIGARQYVLAGNLVRASAMGAIALAPSRTTITVALFVVSLCESGSYSIYRVILVAAVGEEHRVQAVAARRAIGSVGFMLSALLVGIVLSVDTGPAFAAAFGFDALTFLASASLVRRLPRSAGTAGESPSSASADVIRVRGRGAWRDRRYVGLAFVAGVSSLSVPLFEVGLPLWVTRHTDAPAWIYAAAVLLNTAITALLQIRFAKLAVDIRTSVRALALGGGASCVGAAAVALAGMRGGAAWASLLIVAAACLFTVGEMLHSAAWWTISFERAPASQRTEYLVLFDLGLPLAIGLGPPIFVWIIASGALGWAVYGALLMTALLAARLLAGSEQRPEAPAV